MKRSFTLFFAAGLVLAGLLYTQRTGDAKEKVAASPTYTKDVAPILYAKCATCHHPGEAAPMSLMTYKDTRPWAKSIREKVVSREMPPWYADPAHGEWSNDARLTQDQVETIKTWVEGGAKEGDAKDLPAQPKFSGDGWRFGQPDAVLSMTEDATVPVDGTLAYKYYSVPTNFDEDKYVQFAQIRRGEPSVVHHVIITVREPGDTPLPPAGEIKTNVQRVNPETANAGQQQPRQQQQQRGQRRSNNPDGQLIGWAPGMEPLILKPGQAKMIKKGSVLVFQMHYTTNGVAATDRTKVGLWFSKAPVEKRVITQGVFVDPQKLAIPPGDANFESRSSHTFTEDVHIQLFMPHMHVRGKDFIYTLVYPDGTKKVLLNVPKYDFNWQLSYLAKEPIAVPKGSRIECVAHHDNSANNKFNPDPTITVRWGDQTWEEMMIGWIDYTIDGQNLRTQQTASK
ncbi:MAG: thiol-disulfide isomerase [Acidobacteriota bacterium]